MNSIINEHLIFFKSTKNCYQQIKWNQRIWHWKIKFSEFKEVFFFYSKKERKLLVSLKQVKILIFMLQGIKDEEGQGYMGH